MDPMVFDGKYISRDGTQIEKIKCCKKTYKVMHINRYEQVYSYIMVKRIKFLRFLDDNEFKMFNNMDDLKREFRKGYISDHLRYLNNLRGDDMIMKRKMLFLSKGKGLLFLAAMEFLNDNYFN